MDMLNDTVVICDSPLSEMQLDNTLVNESTSIKIPDKPTTKNQLFGKVLGMEYSSPLAHFGKKSRKRLSVLLDDSVVLLETPHRKKRKNLRRPGKSLSETDETDVLDDSVIVLSDSEIEKNHEHAITTFENRTTPTTKFKKCVSGFEHADIIVVDHHPASRQCKSAAEPVPGVSTSRAMRKTTKDEIQKKLDNINITEDISLISNLHLGSTEQKPVSIDLEVEDAEPSNDTGKKPEDVAVVWTSVHSPIIKSKHAARASDASCLKARAHNGNMVVHDTHGDFANLHRLDSKSRNISKKHQGTIGNHNPNWATFVNNNHSHCTMLEKGPKKTSSCPIPESAIKPPGTLREIVIDGSNIAMAHRNGKVFSETGLKIVIDYFKKRGHTIKAFVPQHRRSLQHQLLEKLYTDGIVVFTPSRRVQGRMITPYDDRYILEYATLCGGIVVSLDQYRDLYAEKPEWRDTIENRLLAPTFVGDHIMFPEDPLGRKGPKLEEFLRH